MPYVYEEQARYGESGVLLAIAALDKDPRTVSVTDMPNDLALQAKGIDVVWERKDGRRYVEVKCDSKAGTTGNFALETVSNEALDSIGCILGTEADYYCYVVPALKRLYLMPLPATREWFLARSHEFKDFRAPNLGYVTIGKLVPIERLLADLPGVETILL